MTTIAIQIELSNGCSNSLTITWETILAKELILKKWEEWTR